MKRPYGSSRSGSREPGAADAHPHDHHREQEAAHVHGHGHAHLVVDPSIAASRRGLWAVKWSFVGLAATALLQLGVVSISGSVALLADTIHNFGDAATAIPLGVSFLIARARPSSRFPYGLGRVEDLAGLLVVAIILFSAVVAGVQAIDRLLNPRAVSHLGAVAAASLVGFLGNEAVAVFRMRVGREIGSAALVADGRHARVDGLTSLGVLLGAGGVALGYPVADPIVGLAITTVILGIVWQSARDVISRMLDGVEPGLLADVEACALAVPGVRDVGEVRARWVGHRLRAEVNVAVRGDLTVAEGHGVALDVRHRLLHELTHLDDAIVHVDPEGRTGERHHRVAEHVHDGLAPHGHP